MTARMFAALGRHLVLEFVPREDSQVQRMLATRADVFDQYSLDALQSAYDPYFTLMECKTVRNSKRALLLFARKGALAS